MMTQARQGIGMITGDDGVASLLDELSCGSTVSQVILMRAEPEPFLARPPGPDGEGAGEPT